MAALIAVVLCLSSVALARSAALDVAFYSDSVTLTVEPRSDRSFYRLELGWHGLDYRSGYRPCLH